MHTVSNKSLHLHIQMKPLRSVFQFRANPFCFNDTSKREQLYIITGAQLKQWHQFVSLCTFHYNGRWSVPCHLRSPAFYEPRGHGRTLRPCIFPECLWKHAGKMQDAEKQDDGWVRTHRVISIQLRTIAEDLVGKAVQVLDVLREPWHWRIKTFITCFYWHFMGFEHFILHQIFTLGLIFIGQEQ